MNELYLMGAKMTPYEKAKSKLMNAILLERRIRITCMAEDGRSTYLTSPDRPLHHIELSYEIPKGGIHLICKIRIKIGFVTGIIIQNLGHDVSFARASNITLQEAQKILEMHQEDLFE